MRSDVLAKIGLLGTGGCALLAAGITCIYGQDRKIVFGVTLAMLELGWLLYLRRRFTPVHVAPLPPGRESYGRLTTPLLVASILLLVGGLVMWKAHWESLGAVLYVSGFVCFLATAVYALATYRVDRSAA